MNIYNIIIIVVKLNFTFDIPQLTFAETKNIWVVLRIKLDLIFYISIIMEHVFLTFYIIITIVIVPNYSKIIITNSIVY